MINNNDIQAVFAECVDRMTAGESIESCLARFPSFAPQLRPLLQVGARVRQLRPSMSESVEDQALVWERIEENLPVNGADGSGLVGGGFRPLILLAVLFILAGVIVFFGQTIFDEDNPSGVVLTATYTQAPPTLTQTPTRMLTSTPTITPTASLTLTQPSPSSTPMATLQTGQCGGFVTEEQVREQVLEIYPNTTITELSQEERFGGTLIWQVQISHGLQLLIGAECGVILQINRVDGGASGNVPDSGGNNPGGNFRGDFDDDDDFGDDDD